MPETRYIDTYEDGVLVSHEPYEVFDEQLHQEQLAQEANDKSHQGLIAYDNWDSLTPFQKDAVLKNILWYLLYKEGML